MEVSIVTRAALELPQSWILNNPPYGCADWNETSEQNPKFLENSCNISWQGLKKTESLTHPFAGV